MDLLLKALDPNTRRIGGILVPFGSPDNKDAHGEYFSDGTIGVDYYYRSCKRIPALSQHNKMRDLLKMFGINIPDQVPLEIPIGYIEKMEKTPEGWYAEAVLAAIEKAHEWYVDTLYKATEKGFLSWSSGSTPLPPTLRRDADGHIKTAYVIEGTLTPVPAANPRYTHISPLSRVAHAMKSLDIPLPEELDDEESPAGEESIRAEIDKAMSVDETTRAIFEAFRSNERATAEQEGRYPAYPMDRYDDYLIVEQGSTYWRVPYQVAPAISFAPRSQWIQVKREWVEVPQITPLNIQKAKVLIAIRKRKVELNYALR